MNIENTDLKSLIEKALDMRNYSYVPYSHFHVGVALLAKMAYRTVPSVRRSFMPSARA